MSCGVLSASNLNSVTYDCDGPAAEPAATATDLSSYPGTAVVLWLKEWFLCRMTEMVI